MELKVVLPWLKSPMFIAISQALVVAFLANTTAQIIRITQTGDWTFSFAQIARFLLLCMISLPINYWWAMFLERHFPTHYEIPIQETEENAVKLDRPKSGARLSLRPTDEESLPDASSPLLTPIQTPRSLSPVRKRRRLHIGNTIIKVLLDNFTVGVFCNFLIMISVLGFLKGYTGYEIFMDIRFEAVPTILASYTVYTPAAVIAYVWVPAEKRIVWFQFVGLIWGIYISLYIGA